MSAQIYELGRGGMKPITSDGLEVGQRVLQAHRHEVGVICEPFNGHGYTVIFPDGNASDGQRLNSLSPYTRISVVDGVETPHEVERLKKLRIARRDTDRREREEAARQKEVDTLKYTEELKAKYPWAAKTRGYADASKNLKKELSLKFPGVKFSVRKDGSSMNISWTDGPTEKQVEAVSGKYENGHFNGMEDIHEYDSSAYGAAVEAVLGRAKYVFCNRHESPASCPLCNSQLERHDRRRYSCSCGFKATVKESN
jgi:hypothetical protein